MFGRIALVIIFLSLGSNAFAFDLVAFNTNLKTVSFDNLGTPLITRLDVLYEHPRQTRVCREVWEELRTHKVKMIESRITSAQLHAIADRYDMRLDHIARTLDVWEGNQTLIPNQRYVAIIDFNKHASERRLVIIDLVRGEAESYHVSHGKNSDPGNTGWARIFSNTFDSKTSSLGCAIAAGEYRGKNGRRTLMLHGFEATNDQSCLREVVMHPASYVGRGRSHGCPAVRPSQVDEVYDKIGDGGLICSYYDGDTRTYVASSSKSRGEYKKPKVKKSKKKKSKKSSKGKRRHGRR